MNFPDLPHLKQLQKDLWQWPTSRAAVMVGAGFSLDAVPLPGVHKKFPTWRDLALAMFNELHPSQQNETAAEAQARIDRFRETNPLRIASEYEAGFTRTKLDDLIRAQIPDSLYKPGRLHQLLLKLPWSDVFTTNYDTLLERTELPGRVYQTVSKASELITTFAPRIVKLHGSMPSQTPFIVSEEDYRTYPRRFAPFVNSVQQSLLENSFVLVGFSGDDPNFLEWTGWIRDELGESHAAIYLVGPLSIDDAQRSLLTRRGVRPIDLSPVFAESRLPNGLYAASMEWFLNCLSGARQRRPEWWPELDRSPVATPPGHPPTIDSGPVAPERVGSSQKLSVRLDAAVVAKVIARWRFERLNYPGWLIAPAQKRVELWEETKYWIQALTDFASGRPAIDRLLIFFEINWRLQISAVPLFMVWLEPFNRVVDELSEFVVEKRQIPPLPDFVPQEAASTPSVPDVWLQVAFAFLRDARERYDSPRWEELKGKIDRAVQQHPQYADRADYEAALWAMWNVDRLSSKALLSRWQPSPHSPLAGMHKAGLLAEIDELGEAQTILRTALAEIRRALRCQGRNIELLSLEGWCSYLLFAIESSVDFTTMDFAHRDALLEEFRERWEELKTWDCSPWTYKEYFDEALSFSPPKPQKLSSEIRGFDPGRVTLSTHWGVDDVRPFLPAFSYIRLHEQVGIPARLRMLDVGGDSLNKACHSVAPVFGFGTLALLIRRGKLSDLTAGDLLSRVQVATMESALAKSLHAWCLRILKRELNSMTGLIPVGSAQEATVNVLPEVLSRLAFRLEPSDLDQDFRLALRFHQHFAVRYDVRFHQLCVGWFQRLFDAADTELLLKWLPDLIGGSLPDEGISRMGPGAEAWSDPMRHFPKQRLAGLKAAQPELREAIGKSIDWLLRRGSAESGEGRRRALNRLVNVYFAKLMTDDQQRELGRLLWSEAGANSLPDLPEVASLTLLHLPAPAGIDVPSLVKNRILALPVFGAVRQDPLGRTTVDITGPEQPLILEASLTSKPMVQLADEAAGLLEWTQEESKHLYLKALEWWENDKKAFEPRNDPSPSPWASNPVLATLARLGQFLARVVLPRMDWATDGDWQQLLEWLDEIRRVGAFPTVALPYILLKRPAEADTVRGTITTDLNGSVAGAVAAAAKAVRHWIHVSAVSDAPSPPLTLMASLVERVIFRCKPGIHSCLFHLAFLITERHDAITSAQAELLAASLEPWRHATMLPIPEGEVCDFPEDERPALRASIASLAGALRVWYTRSSLGLPEPMGVELWRDSCKSDHLPEVRRAFDFWDQVAG